jgi:adenylylsulfate kinase
MKFSNKKKTYVFIGRFQPFHEGHYRLVKSALKKNDQILFLVMDSFGINKKNPFKFNYVKNKILKRYLLSSRVGLKLLRFL